MTTPSMRSSVVRYGRMRIRSSGRRASAPRARRSADVEHLRRSSCEPVVAQRLVMSDSGRPTSVGSRLKTSRRARRGQLHAQLPIEEDRADVGRVDQVLKVVVGERQLLDLDLQLLIDGRQLLVDRLQLLLAGLELLGRRAQLLVHRLQLFAGQLDAAHLHRCPLLGSGYSAVRKSARSSGITTRRMSRDGSPGGICRIWSPAVTRGSTRDPRSPRVTAAYLSSSRRWTRRGEHQFARQRVGRAVVSGVLRRNVRRSAATDAATPFGSRTRGNACRAAGTGRDRPVRRTRRCPETGTRPGAARNETFRSGDPAPACSDR